MEQMLHLLCNGGNPVIESWLVGWGGKTHSQSVRVRARHFVHQVRALTDSFDPLSPARSPAMPSIARNALTLLRPPPLVHSDRFGCLCGRSCKQAQARAHVHTIFACGVGGGDTTSCFVRPLGSCACGGGDGDVDGYGLMRWPLALSLDRGREDRRASDRAIK